MDPEALQEQLQALLGERYAVEVMHGCVQVLTPAGDHVALVADDPLQVEAELSVVLVDDGREVNDRASDADRLLRMQVAATWRARGFLFGQAGEIHAGESVDDPEELVWSYELPATTLATDLADAVAIIEHIHAAETDFILWGQGGPLTALT